MAVASSKTASSETEVSASAGRRRFTVEYKMRIVHEAAQCQAEGDIGLRAHPEGAA